MSKTLEEMKRELEGRELPKITREEIIEYNERPEVKERGAKVVTIASDRFKNFLILIFAGFLICAGIFTYLAYNDQLKFFNIDIPQCPTPPECPKSPDTSLTCGTTNVTVNCPTQPVTLYCKNST